MALASAPTFDPTMHTDTDIQSDNRGLVILCGVSGAGKDTLIAQVSDRDLRKPISATSRPAREVERNGVDYHFFSREQFEQKISEGALFEWAEFDGNYYGTLLTELEGSGVRLCIRENQGAKEMKERLGATVVGILPPSLEAVRARLRARGDTPEEIEARIALDATRSQEIREIADYVIVNDDLARATSEFRALLDSLESPLVGVA